MKKIISFLCVAILAIVMVSCCPNRSPDAVTTAYLTALKEKDLNKAVDLMYSSDGEITDEMREQIIAVYEDKLNDLEENYGPITSFTLDGVELAEDGKHATVSYTLKYSTGKVDQDKLLTVKVGDKWLVDAGK